MPVYDTPELSVRLVPHSMEARFGAHLKDTNEFGLYTRFSWDGKSFEDYLRSDAAFEQEEVLDVIHVDDPI
ncbi:MAG TPA: hypothetical protein VJY34_26510 [Roseiarcus sp.]|nr:hypothetical protein [Roseiarcus sp.]